MWPQLQEGGIPKRAHAEYFKAKSIKASERHRHEIEIVTLGDSLDVKSPPRSSWGVTRPEELYTLIFRLGRGSRRGELVIGILSETSWRAYTGPRYMAAAFVKSGGAVSRSAGGRKQREGNEWEKTQQVKQRRKKTRVKTGRYNQRHRLQHLPAVWDKCWELVDQWAGIRGARGEQAGLLIRYQCEYDTLQYTGPRPGSRTRHNRCARRKETGRENFTAMASWKMTDWI